MDHKLLVPLLTSQRFRPGSNSLPETQNAEALMGKQLKSSLSILPTNLKSRLTDHEKLTKPDTKTKARYKLWYGRKHSEKPLSELHPGQSVLTRLPTNNKWEKSGIVLFADSDNRLYHIATETELFTEIDSTYSQH